MLSRLEIDTMLRNIKPELTSEQKVALSRIIHINVTHEQIEERRPSSIAASVEDIQNKINLNRTTPQVEANKFLNESKTINYTDQKVIQHLFSACYSAGFKAGVLSMEKK